MIINAIAIANGGSGGGSSKPPVLEELQITENGTYTPNEGVDGFNPVEVNVQPNLQAKSTSTTITENGTSTITLEPDANYDGLSSASVDVNVNVPIPTFETEELVATANGTYTPSTDGYSKVRVNVSEPTAKYVVPNGMKFAYSKAVNTDELDISNVTDMSNMFYISDLTSLDLSGWDTSKVNCMDYMFSGSKIESINIGGLDTSKVNNMNYMFGVGFGSNSYLKSIDFSMCNMSNVTNMLNMFNKVTNLTDLNMTNAILPKMDLTGWGLNSCTALTVDSLVSVLNALPQLDEGQSFTCTIGTDNLAKLTDDQKAIATNKSWTLN